MGHQSSHPLPGTQRNDLAWKEASLLDPRLQIGHRVYLPHSRAQGQVQGIDGVRHPRRMQDACYALVSQDPTYQGDLVGVHVQVALSNAHKSERLKALYGLRRFPQGTRARAALEQILRTESDPRLRSYAHHALKHQDPSYKAAFDARSCEQGIAAARLSFPSQA